MFFAFEIDGYMGRGFYRHLRVHYKEMVTSEKFLVFEDIPENDFKIALVWSNTLCTFSVIVPFLSNIRGIFYQCPYFEEYWS